MVGGGVVGFEMVLVCELLLGDVVLSGSSYNHRC